MVRRALDWVGAGELASRLLPELSGGQRQKVYLAMALAQDTAAVLMDEPTTYLDVSCQLEVMALARRLAEEGRAVVMVLHDLTLALRYAHRAVLLSGGIFINDRGFRKPSGGDSCVSCGFDSLRAALSGRSCAFYAYLAIMLSRSCA